ncbi:hypothetical protein CN675_21925 [Bacillus toyonensis]|uniref:hypothetical protein n=1 Tax=Bacillus toyonensis TaxID=155322 RepID=UPI000BF124BB|nr:hypothetical protein CN675_21925 [Bacillus toyonensis]PEM44332.1 hypothetical protein CN636_13180 [Bacillus toyonensis]TBX66059.1 hypothetical protein E0M28_14835 [Bacillus toyonensis]
MMKTWKKKMGMTMLASAIALGGLATLELVNPVSKAAAASHEGISVNMTQNNYTAPQEAVLKIKNNNSYPMTVVEMLEKQGPSGGFGFIEYSTIIKLQPGETRSISYDTTFPDIWEVWEHNVTKTFRTKVMVFKGIQDGWDWDKLTPKGDVYTNPFKVTFK